MKRILILGFSGAGKSTLAGQLGEKLGIVPTHLDTLHWKSGWIENDKQTEIALLREILTHEQWIIDGGYFNLLYHERLSLADTVIFLDYNRWLCFLHVLKRRILYHKKTRPDMADGCPEKLDWEFIKWILYEGRKKRKQIYETLSHLTDKQIYIFHMSRQAQSLLSAVSYKAERKDDKHESTNELV